MDYPIYEAFTQCHHNLHSVFHHLRFTADLCHPRPEMHWHDQLELIYVLEGTCSIEYDTTCTLVYPGELAIIHCNENHKVQAHSNLVHYYCLILSPLDYRPLPFVLENTCFRRIIRSSAIHEILLHIVDELNTRSEYFQIIVKSLITQLIIDLLRHHTVEPTSLTTLPSSKDPKVLLVQKAIFYIRTHFRETLSLEEVACQIGVSKYYLSHIFKEITQKTVVQFINELKCQYAQKLIYESNYPITEVSERCGFNSLPYFYRTYKRHFGTTPLYSNLENSSKKE